MTNRLIKFTIAILFMQLARAQVKLTETGGTSFHKTSMTPFKKFILPNGLVVILSRNVTNPEVYVDVTYRVGSANDPTGKSGMAHFFEHLMFKGSEHVGDGQHIKIVTEAGGSFWGQTFEDRTDFKNRAPSQYLEQLLWLESDRMGFLLGSLNKEKFEMLQRVIINEREQNVENNVTFVLSEIQSLNFYQVNNPYRTPVIGFRDDIKSISLEDVQQFYLKYYCPNNAILTIAGDFNENATLQLVNKYFGNIVKRSKNVSQYKNKYNLLANKVLNIDNSMIKQPMLFIKFPSAKKFSQEYAAMECLGYLMAGDENGYLNKLKSQYPNCTKLFAYNYSLKNGGEFNIIIYLKPGTDLHAVQKYVLKYIDSFRFISKNLLKYRLEQFKRTIEFRKVFELESLFGVVNNLSVYESTLGRADYFNPELENYRALSESDVMNVFFKYFLKSGSSILIAKPSNDSTSLLKYHKKLYCPVPEPHSDIQRLNYTVLTDKFSRDSIPKVNYVNHPSVPDKLWKHSFNNGIKTIGKSSQAGAILNLNIYFGNFQYNQGLSSLYFAKICSTLWNNCNTKHFDAAGIKDQLNNYGIYYYSDIQDNNICIHVKCLSKYFKEAVAILKERILEPQFTKQILDETLLKLQRESSDNIKNPSYVSGRLFDGINFLGQLCELDTSLTGISNEYSFDNFILFFKEQVLTNIRITVYSNISEKEITNRLSFMENIKMSNIHFYKKPIDDSLNNISKNIFLYDIGKTDQVFIKMGFYFNQPFDYNGDIFKLCLANFILGGNFNSRLNTTLREKRGFTYKITSTLSGSTYTKFFIETIVDRNVLDSAVREIYGIVETFVSNGINLSELEFIKNSVGSEGLLPWESKLNPMEFIQNFYLNAVPDDFRIQRIKTLDTLTLNDVNSLIRKYINPEKMKVLFIGDKESIKSKLKYVCPAIAEISQAAVY